MPEFKIVINDVKAGKSYQKVSQDDSLLGKKLNTKLDGKFVGLDGYELEITGGTDNAGFAMRKDVEGIARKHILISESIGLKKTRRGSRYRKTVAGNTVSSRTVQINTKVTKYGNKSIEDLFGIKKEEKILEKDSKQEELKVEEKVDANPKEKPSMEEVKEPPKTEVKEEPKSEVKEQPKEEIEKPKEEPKSEVKEPPK